MTLFRVPKVTEYALRSLACLARSGQRMSVREIAAQEHLHPASLAKVLHMLCWQGVVHSKRGRQGGFWLAREPNEIRVKEVVEIFQGPFDTPDTPAEPGFPAAWESLYAPTRQALEETTLADLLPFEASREVPRRVTTASDPERPHPRTYFGREGSR